MMRTVHNYELAYLNETLMHCVNKKGSGSVDLLVIVLRRH
jgi:hypothetical protein